MSDPIVTLDVDDERDGDGVLTLFFNIKLETVSIIVSFDCPDVLPLEKWNNFAKAMKLNNSKAELLFETKGRRISIETNNGQTTFYVGTYGPIDGDISVTIPNKSCIKAIERAIEIIIEDETES